MMKEKIADTNSPEIQAIIKEILKNKTEQEEKLDAIFHFVRDSIQFGFLPMIDDYKASEIVKRKKGQCNNKSGVFLTLCRAAGMEVRIHFSGIRKEIQRGLFTGISYLLMPKEISHSWVEVIYNNEWKRIDSFINDQPFYQSGKKKLQQKNWKTGYSISCESGASSSDFDLSGSSFVQMDAVTCDYGTFDDPSDFYKTEKYNNKPGLLKHLIYLINLKRINKRVESVRKSL